jgi:hypothetical protein
LDGIASSPGQSCAFNFHALCVLGQCFQVPQVRGQNGPARFSKRINERVYGRAAPGTSTEHRSASRKGLTDFFQDIACLRKSIVERVTTDVAMALAQSGVSRGKQARGG